jgi:hypothetical protein
MKNQKTRNTNELEMQEMQNLEINNKSMEIDEQGVVWRYNKLADNDDVRMLYSRREESRLPRLKREENEDNDREEEKKKKKKIDSRKSNKILDV